MRRLTLTASALALAALGLSTTTPAGAATATCSGLAGKVRSGEVVHGGRGDDVLIGGARSQLILGGGGDDRICAGGGNDVVRGGSGDDTIHGGGRGDTLLGEGGSDRLFGDILDDKLYGGGGADALIGGHGVDRMFGGSGGDLLRGGVNTDCYFGGGGADTASFATATPPGPAPGTEGVRVDLTHPAANQYCQRGSGVALGDANTDSEDEVLDRIQFVVGSAFSDELVGRPGAAADAGLGADTCAGFAPGATSGCGGGDEKPPGVFSYVFDPATGAPPDPGLIVRGSDSANGDSIAITQAPAGYVLVYGGDGPDTVSVGEGLPPDTTIDVDGGPGDDTLSGSSLGEVLMGGDFPGADRLSGNGGDDALVARGGTPAAGPDTLSGGAGDDQLVADYPCAGDGFSGGPGNDVAGFALSSLGIRARIAGDATLASGGCPGGRATTILGDNEVLEGTRQADSLIGSARSETIWGREGNDLIVGRGGADDLEGFAGRDRIDARDGRRDRKIDCGSGRDRARLDRSDPRPKSC